MRSDWFERSHELLKPIVVLGVANGENSVVYPEGEKVQEALAKMNRDDLEVLAMAAVMYAMRGTEDMLHLKRQ